MDNNLVIWKMAGVNKTTRNGATLEVSCSVSAGLLDICIKCCVFLGAGCLLNFSPSWWGEETRSGFEEGSTSGTLVVTGHAHGEEPRQWVEHFKKGEVVEE